MSETHLTEYIEKYLIPEIVSQLGNETFVSCETSRGTGLDGFMSTLYNLHLTTTTSKGVPKERLLIAKFMKGEKSFRESSKSYIQFANEVFVYAEVLPEYQRILDKAKITAFSVEDLVPKAYVAKYGYVEGLSTSPTERESVLVLENLKQSGYSLGPRLYLNSDQLLNTCKPLGQYHAFSYVLRIGNESILERLKNGIVTLPFINDDDPSDKQNNLYRVLYRVAFDRFYDFFDRKIDGDTFDKKSAEDLKLIERVRLLREKYFAEPTRLLERIRTDIELHEEDRRFAAILHGDYNRNNVLFRYKEPIEGERQLGKVENVKMIDFQELRYGTPCIDLSFLMYFNTPETIRANIWEELLKKYHFHMYQTLSSILKANVTDEQQLHSIDRELEKYNYGHFNLHFSRYAFYGVMICIHFLPWILCSTEECERLSCLFETDMHGEEFRRLSIAAGGDEVNLRILNVIRHACKMGYMDRI